MPARLSVNLNAVAMLRNRRDLPWPSMTGIAALVMDAGAAGVTVHPRPDERHTRASDVYELSRLVCEKFSHCEFNVEGYPDDRFMSLVSDVKPHQVTLVPDDPAQATSDHGWDIDAYGDFLLPIVERIQAQGSRVSIFVDAEPRQATAAASLGADRIELYTGPYGITHGSDEGEQHLRQLVEAAFTAKNLGVEVNAGHDLTLNNLHDLARSIPHLAEVSIGHGLTADALLLGFHEAVRQYLSCLEI